MLPMLLISSTKNKAAQGYRSRVGAAEVHADVNSGPCYLCTLHHSSTTLQYLDVPKYGNATNPNGSLSSTTGAKPWAGSIQAGYGFEAWSMAQNIYVGYQLSREAAGLLLPKDRWLVGYGIELFGKNTNVGLEWDHDNAYSRGNGGRGSNADLVTLRTAFKFA